MTVFLLDNLFWVLAAVFSAAGILWTFARAGKTLLQPQAAILTVSRSNGVFLDIRPAPEFSAAHIPRSQNIPGDMLDARKNALVKFKDKPVVVVCQNGMRSKKTAAELVKDGFNQVYVLAGGIAGWRDGNLPLFNKNAKQGKKQK